MKDLEALPALWCDGPASVLRLVESEKAWHEKLLDGHIVMITEAGGDATPLAQRRLSVLPTVYRLCRSARLRHRTAWLDSWHLPSVFSTRRGRSSVDAWY